MAISFNNGDGSSGGGVSATGIYTLEVYNNSPDLPFFEELIVNSYSYKGVVIYLSRLEEIPNKTWPDPFLFPNKFYFNEDGEWFESPFSLNGVILE